MVSLTALAPAEAMAIEMFTYFGDGSRIGLPSLEVPIEAYPGIPLRRDRLRARRRGVATRQAVGTSAAAGPSRTITIRAMPEAIEAPPSTPSTPAAGSGRRRPKPSQDIPIAPEPEEVPLTPSA